MDLACSDGESIGRNQSGLCIRRRGMRVLKDLHILAVNFEHPPLDRKERLINLPLRLDAYPMDSQAVDQPFVVSRLPKGGFPLLRLAGCRQFPAAGGKNGGKYKKQADSRR